MRAQRLPELGARLMAAYELAERGGLCADIGADHGRLAAALLMGGRADRALITDISEKALRKARSLILRAGLTERAVFCVADGLYALAAVNEECRTVCVLGMGGDTISGILERGRSLLGECRLVLGPQTHLSLVRETLAGIGCGIDRESLVRDGGRYYVIMRAVPGVMEPLSEREQLLGPCLTRERPPLFREYLTRRSRILGAEIAAMKTAVRQDNAERLSRAERELAYVRDELTGI